MTARIPDATRAAIAAAYKARESTIEIARQYGINTSTVLDIARQFGVTTRPQGRRPGDPEFAYEGEWVRDGLILRPTITRKAGK